MSRFMSVQLRVVCALALGMFAYGVFAQQTAEISYLKLSEPRKVLNDHQQWEGNEQNHTLSVVELNRDGFKYWGYYGLNEGRGIGLARSNDLVHWTKYEQNPLWTNARWASVMAGADKKHPQRLYLAITRDYDTPKSHIVLASSDDGIHLKELKTLVLPMEAPRNRNQNPNLFRDPVSGKYFLYFYRGNDDSYFDIVAKSAISLEDLDKASETVLIHEKETVAAPTMLYVAHGGAGGKGVYYLATEIYPHRYANPPQGEWQVKVFASDAPDGKFVPVEGNPVETGERACLFQHIFNGHYYGYQSHLEHPSEQWVMEVVEATLP